MLTETYCWGDQSRAFGAAPEDESLKKAQADFPVFALCACARLIWPTHRYFAFQSQAFNNPIRWDKLQSHLFGIRVQPRGSLRLVHLEVTIATRAPARRRKGNIISAGYPI